jgi:hypothetical protein
MVSLRTPTTSLAQLASPALVAPDEGTTVSTATPTLSWQAVPGVSTYAVDVADNPSYSAAQSSGTLRVGTQSWTPPALDPDRFYYWRVKAFGADGSSEAEGHFWMPITLLAPTHEAALPSTTPILSWRSYKTGGVFADPSRSYRVQIADDPEFASGVVVDVGNLLESEYAVSSGVLGFSETYYWRVRVSSDDGTSAWSTPRSFTTPPGRPAAPDLLAPAHGSRLDVYYPTLTWTPVTGATSYRVRYVCSSCANDAERVSGDLTAASLLFNPFWGGDQTANGAQYEWWVEAHNVSGISASSHWTMSLPAPATPSAPMLQGPADGSTVGSLTPSFAWSAATYTKTYRFQLGTGLALGGITGQVAGPTFPTSPNPAPLEFVYTPDEASALPLEYDTTYYWQVTALSIGGPSARSEVWSFRTPPREAVEDAAS